MSLLPLIFAISGAVSDCPSTTGGTSGRCQTHLPVSDLGSGLHIALQLVFGVAAVISILFIIIGALKFVTSDGNSQDAAKARETVIYAVVGLVVSLLAEGIVSFILTSLGGH